MSVAALGGETVGGQGATGAARVILLTRTNCHLCVQVQSTVREVCAATGAPWAEIDVDADADLRSEYGDQVPVVLVDGEFLSSLRLDADTLRTALNRSV